VASARAPGSAIAAFVPRSRRWHEFALALRLLSPALRGDLRASRSQAPALIPGGRSVLSAAAARRRAWPGGYCLTPPILMLHRRAVRLDQQPREYPDGRFRSLGWDGFAAVRPRSDKQRFPVPSDWSTANTVPDPKDPARTRASLLSSVSPGRLPRARPNWLPTAVVSEVRVFEMTWRSPRPSLT